MTDAADPNPLLAPWDAPYALPPFARLKPAHFGPAFDVALAEQRAEVEAIAAAPEPPDFENTAAAFDRSGRRLSDLECLFYNLASANTSPGLQAVEREMAPRLAEHSSWVFMHEGLFRRLDALHADRDRWPADAEQRRLLERLHLDFVRAGARLTGDAQVRYAQVMARLATLTTQFAQNVLADESSYRLVLQGDDDLAGLPAFVRAAARQAAADRGIDAPGVITLARSHILPFLSFSERRDLREALWRAWTTRGEHDGENDNRPIAREILALRHEQARLHGHASFADYALADSMALHPGAVDRLLMQVWEPARRHAADEQAALEALRLERGDPAPIEPWDWRYLAEKVRQRRYDVDEAVVKPYFSLEHMTEAAFECAGRLFGLRFVEQPGVRTYHPDVRVYEVRELRDGADVLVGVFLHDNIARAGKRSGAWMSHYRPQSRQGGRSVVPLIANHNNFARGAPGEPTLLSFDDARTLFHEFGHGLHGLLSNVTYQRLSGTNVLRDFVELPSQLFEHWLSEPEVLQRHARHHATGEPIPAALVERLKAARRFNQGYETLRYTASALVDMAVHGRTDGEPVDIGAFEAQVAECLGLPRAVGMNHRLPHFLHLFAGSGYAAGYYVYLWAEVLDADGYGAFDEAGDPFDPQVAQRLRRFIYGSGDSIEPGEAYRAFRGRDPTVDAMLAERGLVDVPG